MYKIIIMTIVVYTLNKILILPYLNRFRGKPAITKFDKPFTPNYNLSQNFATFMSSV